MTKFFHVAQVHPIENGELNIYTVVAEREFPTEIGAKRWVEYYNNLGYNMRKQGATLPNQQAVYTGRANGETRELV